jgi:glyoxylase-like metal-dependent hydrolase (beta-lactamase superfamily II)
VHDGEIVFLGEADWQIVATPGHTPGHLSLWQPDERLLIVGDALSDHDVGWVATALEGPGAALTAVASLERLVELNPRVLLPAHGRMPADTPGALAHARRRAQRLVDDPDGAVWYGARRIFGYALMIRGGVPTKDLESYLLDRAWLADAALQLRRSREEIASELVATMRRSGAVVERDGRIRAAAEHAPVDPRCFEQPWPRAWPSSSSAAPR